MNRRVLPKVVAITSGKGGVGKTNVVANIAISLAMIGRKVLLLDADMGLGNIDILLGLAPRFNISHFLRGKKSLEEIVVNGPRGIKILPAASGLNELTNLCVQDKLNLFSQMETLDGHVDVMLIDTASGISQDVLFFNMAAQEIIVVASPEPTSIVDAYALMKALYKKGGEKRFHLLVNAVRNEKEGLEVYRNICAVADRYLNISIDYLGQVPFDEKMTEAVRRQTAVVELFPESKAYKGFMRLAKALDELPPHTVKDNVQFFLNHASN